MNTAGINAPGSLVLPPILSILRASALLSESLGESHLYINYISISTEISLFLEQDQAADTQNINTHSPFVMLIPASPRAWRVFMLMQCLQQLGFLDGVVPTSVGAQPQGWRLGWRPHTSAQVTSWWSGHGCSIRNAGVVLLLPSAHSSAASPHGGQSILT